MAQRSRQLRLSPRAEADLEAIYDYTAQHWSVKQAVSYLKDLDVTLKRLRSGRRIGREAGFEPGLMKVNHGAHVIYYQATDLSLDVVRILHAAMEAPRHLGT